MSFAVPTIDIAPFVRGGSEAERADVLVAVDLACREVGFMQLLGHGIPDGVIAGLAAAMDAFFALDPETKKGYRTPPGINRGYSPPKSESLSLSLGIVAASRMNDYFEAFNVGDGASLHPTLELPAEVYPENIWPDAVPGFTAQVTAYYEEARRVARVLTGVFEQALDLEPGFFDAITGHSIDVMRMNNYALPPGSVDLDGELTGMGEHTDYGIVTVLWADQVAGLQVLGRDRLWHDVQPADGALLVNLGDVTARLTNEQWLSTLHRVKPPVVNGTIERRRSAAYFHDGDYDALIETLPSCVDAAHPLIYDAVTVGEHIAAKLAGSRAGVRNTDAAREAQRVLTAHEG